MGADRERVLRALHYLDEHRLIELRASEPRLRFSRTDNTSADAAALVDTLAQRFQHREEQAIDRLQQVLRLVEEPGCQTAALVGYFGERLAAPCGQCTSCESSAARTLPSPPPAEAIERRVNAATFSALCGEHPSALGHPRQRARFLCGLTSPALTQSRLSRHSLFGILDGLPFTQVLAWCAR